MGAVRKHVAKGKFRRVKCKLVVALIVLFGLASVGLAQQASQPIVPDGNTQTSLTTTGNVTDITTSTISGNNAYNSFSTFNVNSGSVANLYLPNGTSNLLNLVNSQTVNIDGLLNAIQNGQIGGNVFFADPYGVIVGASGVVNVGSFTAMTPTQSFMSQFFTFPGAPSSGATAAMLNGTVPISPGGLISIQGTVNAVGNVGLYGGTVSNSGVIQSGAVFSGSSPDFSDVVNTNGIQNGASIAVQTGNIVIVAAGNIENAGAIATNGGSNINAGKINVQAAGNVTLDSGSLISASGSGQNSNGGKTTISAQGDGELASGAGVTAIGGSGSGDGGTIDFSAKGALNDDGGLLEAGASAGTAGTATLNGGKLFINANDVPNDGTNLAFTANNSITVLPYVVISSRQIGTGTNALTSPSTGDSGSISFDAPTITLGNITDILANATGTYTPGDITMTAKQSVADAPGNPLPSISANAQINIGNATISGRNVIITADAEADANKTPTSDANKALNDTALGNLIGSYGLVSFKAAGATSNVAIGDTGSPGGGEHHGLGRRDHHFHGGSDLRQHYYRCQRLCIRSYGFLGYDGRGQQRHRFVFGCPCHQERVEQFPDR